MVESFKITAQKLKRILKISVHLPHEYNLNNEVYPLILILDGQFFFNFINETTQKVNITEDLEKTKAICIALHSPKIEAWRISELNPYYNGNDETVDIVLSYIYFDYIVNDLIPLLKQRYRFSNEIYLCGFEESAIAALYMTYKYSIFNGAGLFNPSLSECNNKLNDDLQNNFTSKKKIYLYFGSKDTNEHEDNKFYSLYTRFEALKTEMLLLDYDSAKDNSFTSYKNSINNFFNFILP